MEHGYLICNNEQCQHLRMHVADEKEFKSFPDKPTNFFQKWRKLNAELYFLFSQDYTNKQCKKCHSFIPKGNYRWVKVYE
jgi:hypothetical protein